MWDTLVGRSWNGTILHTRRFLGYHGDRFLDQSLVVEDQHGTIRAVFPAAVDPARAGTVTSHPGATYGGIVHDGWIHGGRAIHVVGSLASHYRSLGFRSLTTARFRTSTTESRAEDDLYALFRLDAQRHRCDLSTTIDLSHERRMRKGRRASLQKARRLGVEVEWNWSALENYWPILEEALARRHGVRPAHSVEEMALLADLFPNEISLAVARERSDRRRSGILPLPTGTPPPVHWQHRTGKDGWRCRHVDRFRHYRRCRRWRSVFRLRGQHRKPRAHPQ